jgi:hypothetical protein
MASVREPTAQFTEDVPKVSLNRAHADAEPFGALIISYALAG